MQWRIDEELMLTSGWCFGVVTYSRLSRDVLVDGSDKSGRSWRLG